MNARSVADEIVVVSIKATNHEFEPPTKPLPNPSPIMLGMCHEK